MVPIFILASKTPYLQSVYAMVNATYGRPICFSWRDMDNAKTLFLDGLHHRLAQDLAWTSGVHVPLSLGNLHRLLAQDLASSSELLSGLQEWEYGKVCWEI